MATQPPTSDFKPLNRLEELLVRAANDPVARPDFYRELLVTDIYFATPAPATAGATFFSPGGSKISILCIDGPQGSFTPCFSARERLEEVMGRDDQVGFVAIRGDRAFEILAQQHQPVVVNPGLPFGVELSPDEVKRIGAGAESRPAHVELKEGTRVAIGEPLLYPVALVDALQRCFATRPNVARAHIAEIRFPGEPPHPVVGLVSTAFGADVEEAGTVAREVVRGGRPVDFLQLHDAEDGEGVGDYLRDVPPFYQRGRSAPSVPSAALTEAFPKRRQDLFAQLTVSEWGRGRTDAEPWVSFERARVCLAADETETACAALRSITAMPALHSRHHLVAWNALRQLGVQPTRREESLPLAVIVEIGAPGGGADLLATYADKSPVFFSWARGGMTWEGTDARFEQRVDAVLDGARVVLPYIGKPREGYPPPPLPELARINVLTPSGQVTMEAPVDRLESDPMSAAILVPAASLLSDLIRFGRLGREESPA